MSAARKIEQLEFLSMISQQGDFMEKPSLDEVLSYARMMVRKCFVDIKKAGRAPKEQQAEMEQEAYIRIIDIYPGIKAEKWKSYVYKHCWGAIKDYLKHGDGFEHMRTSIQKPEEVGDVHVGKIYNRVSLHNSDGEELSLDDVVGKSGVFSQLDLQQVSIKWDLIARMASQDECLRAFAMWLRGGTLEKIAPVFGVKVARAGQLVQAFIERFDDPEHADSHWFKQCCFAFGICEMLGLPNVDQTHVLKFSVGWNLPEVDLDTTTPCQWIRESESQMSLLDAEA